MNLDAMLYLTRPWSFPLQPALLRRSYEIMFEVFEWTRRRKPGTSSIVGGNKSCVDWPPRNRNSAEVVEMYQGANPESVQVEESIGIKLCLPRSATVLCCD